MYGDVNIDAEKYKPRAVVLKTYFRDEVGFPEFAIRYLIMMED